MMCLSSLLFDLIVHSWDKKLALDLVRAANPSEDAEAIADLADLLLRIRALVCKFSLSPCVRTKYTRVALQSATTNRFRLTVDRDITVINERGCGSSLSKSWCLADDDIVPEQDVVKLPYCVYEVKVADGTGGPPAFVAELEEKAAIVEAKKFSKFLSGASVFNADKVATLPWWAEDTAFIPLYQAEEERSDDLHGTDAADPGENLCQPLPPICGNHPASHTSQVGGLGLGLRPLDASKHTEKTNSFSSACSVERIKKDTSSSSRRSLLRRISTFRARRVSILPSHKQNRIAPKTRLRVEPKSHFANVSLFVFHWKIYTQDQRDMETKRSDPER